MFSNLAVSSTGGNRRKLTLRLSADGGRTWPHGRVISEGFSGYSDLAVTDRGKILCLFENGSENYRQKISLVVVDRAWLTSGEPNK